MIAAITLPWPPRALSPNARKHWRTVAPVRKAYREACGMQAIAQGVRRPPDPKAKLQVSLVFYTPTRRAYDLDNLLASMKAGLDGLADAIGVDDRHWGLSIARSDEVGGFVRVEVTHA